MGKHNGIISNSRTKPAKFKHKNDMGGNRAYVENKALGRVQPDEFLQAGYVSPTESAGAKPKSEKTAELYRRAAQQDTVYMHELNLATLNESEWIEPDQPTGLAPCPKFAWADAYGQELRASLVDGLELSMDDDDFVLAL